jgi:hypothetical protein
MGRRPIVTASRPIVGAMTATTSCGSTMHAAIKAVAQAPERTVISVPTSGSMAALAA